jgi:hypothetical protein
MTLSIQEEVTMTKLSKALCLLGLALSIPAFAAGGHVDNPGQTPMKDGDAVAVVKLNKACGYSLGGYDTAASDAQNNATNACIAAGCTGADVRVSYLPWRDGEYYRVCVGYVCTGCPVA